MQAEQRRVLQGCRARVECRFDVRVQPPSKNSSDGRGTVTGAPEDVADALEELRKLLCPAVKPAGTAVCITKAKSTKGKDSKAKKKDSKTKDNVNKDNKPKDNKNKAEANKGKVKVKDKQVTGKQKKN